MKYCDKCKIHVETEHNVCPLCYGDLTGEGNNKGYFKPRKSDIKTQKHTNTLLKIFALSTLLAVVITGFIDIATNKYPTWSIIVILSLLYIWLLISHTILSKRSLFEKILFQLGVIIAILFTCENLYSGGNWMVNYVLPSICILSTLVLNLLSIFGEKKYHFIWSCLTMYLLITILSIVLICLSITTYKILNISSLIYSAFSIVATFLLYGKNTTAEFKKKMHL